MNLGAEIGTSGEVVGAVHHWVKGDKQASEMGIVSPDIGRKNVMDIARENNGCATFGCTQLVSKIDAQATPRR
jgi:hypothetical protein